MTRSRPPSALGALLSRKVRLVRQSKDRPCNTEPSQLKFAYWHKLRRAMAGGLVGREDGGAPLDLSVFYARRQIHGWSNAGESSRFPLPMFPYKTSPT